MASFLSLLKAEKQARRKIHDKTSSEFQLNDKISAESVQEHSNSNFGEGNIESIYFEPHVLDTSSRGHYCLESEIDSAWYFPGAISSECSESLLRYLNAPSPHPSSSCRWHELSSRRLRLWGSFPEAADVVAGYENSDQNGLGNLHHEKDVALPVWLAGLAQQLSRFAMLDDASVTHHNDEVCIGDSREPMRHCELRCFGKRSRSVQHR